MFKRLLLINTGNGDPRSALARAIALAGRHHATLTLLDVADPIPEDAVRLLGHATVQKLTKDLADQQQSRLEALAAEARLAGVAVATAVRTGNAFRVAIHEVLTGKHDLVIKTIDTPESGARSLLDSTDKHLLRKCPCPVFLVKSGRAFGRQNLLAAVEPAADDAEKNALSTQILEAAVEAAYGAEGTLHILYAWHLFGEALIATPTAYDPEIADVFGRALNLHNRLLDETAARLPPLPAGIAVRTHLVHDRASRAIVRFVADNAIDLLVMGTATRGRISGLLIGTTAERVLSEVGCSILALKPPGFVSPVRLEGS